MHNKNIAVLFFRKKRIYTLLWCEFLPIIKKCVAAIKSTICPNFSCMNLKLDYKEIFCQM